MKPQTALAIGVVVGTSIGIWFFDMDQTVLNIVLSGIWGVVSGYCSASILTQLLDGSPS